MNQLIGWSGQKVLLPFYHVVSNQEKDHYKHLYPVKSVEEFESDLDFLVKYYSPVSLKELIDIVEGGKKPKKPVFHLTFDDGLSEFYDVVAPILKRRNIPVTVFVNTDFIDNKGLFYRFKASLLAERFSAKGMLDLNYQDNNEMDELAQNLGFSFDDYLSEEQPYLTSSQITELVQEGFTFGGHSVSHPLYHELGADEQVVQTIDSVNYMVEKFNLSERVFSFPFTDDGVKREFYNQVNKKLDLTFGTAGLKKDIASKNLQRLGMENNQSAETLLKFHYLYYILKSFVGKNKLRR